MKMKHLFADLYKRNLLEKFSENVKARKKIAHAHSSKQGWIQYAFLGLSYPLRFARRVRVAMACLRIFYDKGCIVYEQKPGGKIVVKPIYSD